MKAQRSQIKKNYLGFISHLLPEVSGIACKTEHKENKSMGFSFSLYSKKEKIAQSKKKKQKKDPAVLLSLTCREERVSIYLLFMPTI